MKKTNVRKFTYVFVLIFCLSFNIVQVDAAGGGAGKSFGEATTCEYEMYQTHIGSGSSGIGIGNYYVYGTTQVVYKGSSKKNYTISITKKYEGDNKSADSFKDNGFAKKVTKSGCPKYVKLVIGTIDYSLDEMDSEKFLSMASTGMYKLTLNYPLLLVKENGKSVSEPMDKFLIQETKYWIDYKATDAYTNLSEQEKADVLSFENKFIENIKSSSIYSSVISKNGTWTKYIDSLKTDELIKEKEDKLTNVKGDYCALYCTTQCKNVTPSSAQSACNSSCQSEQLPKCNAAVQSCAHAPLDVYDKCIQGQLSTQGLNTQYTEERKTEIQNLEKEIEELYKVKRAGTKGLKLSFNNAKLQCSDVISLHKYWVLLEIIAPILVVLFGSIDYLTSIIASDEDKIMKARKKFPNRLIAAVLLILASVIINVVVNISTNESVNDDSLMKCIINGN